MVDLRAVQRTWERRHGRPWTCRAMGSAGAYGPMARAALGLAYDSARGLGRRAAFGRARDQSYGGDLLGNIKVFLKNRLDVYDYATLERMIGALSGEGEGEEDVQALPDGGSYGEPPDFPGRPRTNTESVSTVPEEGRIPRGEWSKTDGGGKDRRRPAMDSRGNSYLDQFPGNIDVDTSDYGSGSGRR